MALTKFAVAATPKESEGVYVGLKLPIADVEEYAGLVGGKVSMGGAQLARLGITKITGVEFEASAKETNNESMYVGVKVSNAKAAEIAKALEIDANVGGTNLFKTIIQKLLS